ncbi:MAG: VWA domain-containing protein [Magnetococcus sp. WYHC-3]
MSTNQSTNQAQRIESLGPAERIINTLTSHVDHIYHGRPGFVVQDPSSLAGVKWSPVTHKVEEGVKVVYQLDKVGKQTRKTRLGVLGEDNKIRNGMTVVGEYRKPGIFPEVATYLYDQIAKVWQMDNEFVARWASYAYGQEYRDLKVLLAAFMLVQSRSGAPVRENGQILFSDDDHRTVGEAMVLLKRKDGKDIDPKGLVRIFDILAIPGIAEINRRLGFGKSSRNPMVGRLPKTVTKWLSYREQNLPLFQGLVKSGWRSTVMTLCKKVGYKPETATFFEILRWKQNQAKDGRRQLAIGTKMAAAESWEGLTERQICNRIMKEKPAYKKMVGMLPSSIGLTKAIMAAAVEAGSVSDSDLIILTPTLEDFGLLNQGEVKSRWEQALLRAENQRASHIAERVHKKETIEKLQDASDTAAKKAIEEVVRGLRIYVIVDKSGSMRGAIDRAKVYISKFLQSIPLDKLHVSTFNTVGKVLTIKHASAAGVEQAFRGEMAGGGTLYGQGVRVLSPFKPTDEEDSLFIFVGDQCQMSSFTQDVQSSGLRPSAFGMIEVPGEEGKGHVVEETAKQLEIPCFNIGEDMFQDPYAVSRILRNLIASTPVGKYPAVSAARVHRVSLVETILQTELLQKPAWA